MDMDIDYLDDPIPSYPDLPRGFLNGLVHKYDNEDTQDLGEHVEVEDIDIIMHSMSGQASECEYGYGDQVQWDEVTDDEAIWAYFDIPDEVFYMLADECDALAGR